MSARPALLQEAFLRNIISSDARISQRPYGQWRQFPPDINGSDPERVAAAEPRPGGGDLLAGAGTAGSGEAQYEAGGKAGFAVQIAQQPLTSRAASAVSMR